VKAIPELPPETRLSHITYLVSEILPPHSPKAIETGKSHKESNYWLPSLGSGNQLRPA